MEEKFIINPSHESFVFLTTSVCRKSRKIKKSVIIHRLRGSWWGKGGREDGGFWPCHDKIYLISHKGSVIFLWSPQWQSIYYNTLFILYDWYDWNDWYPLRFPWKPHSPIAATMSKWCVLCCRDYRGCCLSLATPSTHIGERLVRNWNWFLMLL